MNSRYLYHLDDLDPSAPGPSGSDKSDKSDKSPPDGTFGRFRRFGRTPQTEFSPLGHEPWQEAPGGFPTYIARLVTDRTDASALTIHGSGRACCHCGRPGGTIILRVAIPEGIFPVDRACIDAWYAGLPPYGCPDHHSEDRS
jgi:hypothetical protein